VLLGGGDSGQDGGESGADGAGTGEKVVSIAEANAMVDFSPESIIPGQGNPKFIMKDKSLNLNYINDYDFRGTIIIYQSRCVSIYLKTTLNVNFNSYFLVGCLRYCA
jgi:hypothetical protein